MEKYEINSYKAEVGGAKDSYYASVQVLGSNFYGLIYFCKTGPLPAATAPTTYGQRFYGYMDFQQMPIFIDLLRNEKPVNFGWLAEDPNLFQLMTGTEAVGEGDGILAPKTP